MASVEKKVRFSTTHFFQVLDNLFVSDQIATFDEELLQSHQIDSLINLTPSTPFLSTKTSNIHVPIFTSKQNVSLLQVDDLVDQIFSLLRNKKKVLVFCENGIEKSLVLLVCFFIKHYDSEQVKDANRFLTWKTKQELSDSNKYFYMTRLYRDYILKKSLPSQPTKKTKIIQHLRNHFSNS